MKAGWITPDKKVFECGQCKHTIFIIEGNLSEYVDISDLKDNLEKLRRNVESQSFKDWQIYSIAREDFYDEVYDRAISNGLIRFMVSDGTIYFEGLSEALSQCYDKCVSIAKENDLRYQFEPV